MILIAKLTKLLKFFNFFFYLCIPPLYRIVLKLYSYGTSDCDWGRDGGSGGGAHGVGGRIASGFD